MEKKKIAMSGHKSLPRGGMRQATNGNTTIKNTSTLPKGGMRQATGVSPLKPTRPNLPKGGMRQATRNNTTLRKAGMGKVADNTSTMSASGYGGTAAASLGAKRTGTASRSVRGGSVIAGRKKKY